MVERDINSGAVAKHIDLCCHPEMKCHVQQLRHYYSNIAPILWCCLFDFTREILGDLHKNLDCYRSPKYFIVMNFHFSIAWLQSIDNAI